MQKNNPKEAAIEMAKSLREIFKKFSLSSRTKAWEALTSDKGEKEIQTLLIHPNKPVNRIASLSFKEWLETLP